jgi:hypothetical protein
MNWLDSALEDLGKPADGVRSPPPARAAPLHLRPVTGWHSSTRTSEPRPNVERSSWSTTPRLSGVSSPSPRLDQVIPHFQSLEDALEAARERGGCLPRPVRRFHAERGQAFASAHRASRPEDFAARRRTCEHWASSLAWAEWFSTWRTW